MESQPSSEYNISSAYPTEDLKVAFEFAQLMGELSLTQRGIIMRELLRIHRQQARVFHSLSVLLEVVNMTEEEEAENSHGE